MGEPTGAEELDVGLHRPREDDRRCDRRDLSPPSTACLTSSLLRIVGWVIGTGEVWMATRVLGHPLNLIDSFILESLSSGVRGAAFMVPGALGAQESGMVLFGALLGLPADLALAVSLTKRVRELALGLPGLAAWQWVEGRRLLARQTDQASSTL